MRITNSMMVSKYTKTLNNSLTDLNTYANQITSGLKFDTFSQSPVLATRAYKVRTESSNLENYLTNIKDANTQLSNAESAVMDVQTAVSKATAADCLQAITATSGKDEREIIATKLRRTQESILQTLNSKSVDTYLFGGLNTRDVPFTLNDKGELLYRGVNVNTGKMENKDGAIANINNVEVSFGKDNGTELNGYTVKVVNDDASMSVGTAAVDTDAKTITVNLAAGSTANDFKNVITDPSKISVTGSGAADFDADFSKISVTGNLEGKMPPATSAEITDTADLKSMANEQMFIDIGVGLKFNDDGTVNSQSALDIAMPGISFTGYGLDEDGSSNNIYNLLGEIADKLDSGSFSYDETKPLVDKLSSINNSTLLGAITKLGVKTDYIENMQSRFEDNQYNLTIKSNSIEAVDKSEAIMNYMMQEYAYRATLQMGSNLLQASLLDYLK